MWRGGMDGWPAELEPVQAAHPVRRQPARTPPDRKRLHHVFTRDLVGHLLLLNGVAPGRFLSDASFTTRSCAKSKTAKWIFLYSPPSFRHRK